MAVRTYGFNKPNTHASPAIPPTARDSPPNAAINSKTEFVISLLFLTTPSAAAVFSFKNCTHDKASSDKFSPKVMENLFISA